MNALIFKYRGLLWGIFAVAVFAFPVSFSPVRMLLAVPLLLCQQFPLPVHNLIGKRRIDLFGTNA